MMGPDLYRSLSEEIYGAKAVGPVCFTAPQVLMGAVTVPPKEILGPYVVLSFNPGCCWKVDLACGFEATMLIKSFSKAGTLQLVNLLGADM